MRGLSATIVVTNQGMSVVNLRGLYCLRKNEPISKPEVGHTKCMDIRFNINLVWVRPWHNRPICRISTNTMRLRRFYKYCLKEENSIRPLVSRLTVFQVCFEACRCLSVDVGGSTSLSMLFMLRMVLRTGVGAVWLRVLVWLGI